jgi:hypothetical protein
MGALIWFPTDRVTPSWEADEYDDVAPIINLQDWADQQEAAAWE